MNKEEIVRIAREAGFITSYGGRETASDELLERFAAAAFAAGAATERQAMLETIDALYNSQDPNPMYQEGYNHALDNMEEFVKARSKS